MLPPTQTEAVEGDIEAVGSGFTVTVLEKEVVHPFALVTVTE